MLFLLTGDVQMGKTRWLQRTCTELAAAGVPVAGVVAPGVWRERSTKESADGLEGCSTAHGHAVAGCPSIGDLDAAGRGRVAADCKLAGEGRFEKLGIDNVLLPEGERVPFARRRDLAIVEGSYSAGSQSAKAQLGWEISDSAIERANKHFLQLAMPYEKHSFSQTDVSRETSLSHEGFCDAASSMKTTGSADCAISPPEEARSRIPGLLVVDELGQLELLRHGGLTEAVAMLDAGANDRFAHALVVVRDWLLSRACTRFAGPWGGASIIAPDREACAALHRVFD